MTRWLHRLGGAAAGHPWRTATAWLGVLAVAVALVSAVGGTPHDDWDVPGTRSQAGTDLLRAEFPGAAGAADRVVVHDRDGTPIVGDEVAALSARLGAMPHVSTVAPPRIADGGATVLLDVRYDVPVTDPDLMGELGALQEAVGPTRDAGLQVELGGDVPDSAAGEVGGTGELVGVSVALLLLVLTFGSVVAAGLPILVALLGLGVGSSGVLLFAAVMDVSTSAPTVATMVGLGVGIDYALLLVSRHVELLSAGVDVRTAAARATATAGRSVVFAAATVLVSLMGLRLAGLQTYASFGFATALVVLAVAAAALTLVPAALGLAGRRVLPRRARRGRPARSAALLTGRWAARVGRRPVPWAVSAVALLAVLAVPTFDMRMWPADTGAQPADTTTRKAYDLVAAEFGPGANGPFLVAVDLDRVAVDRLPSLAQDLAAVPGVAGVSPPQVSPSGGAATLVLEPTTAPSDERTTELVHVLRDEVLPDGAELTGLTPALADITELLSERSGWSSPSSSGCRSSCWSSSSGPSSSRSRPQRSNLLSIAASYGVVVAVFSWGWGSSLLGLDHAVPVSSWIPS